MMNRVVSISLIALGLAAAALVARADAKPRPAAMAAPPPPISLADAKWQPLVPKLGARGPQLSVVFGDLKRGPVGLLLKIPAGFTPGPHTHSSDYWGVVISGEMEDTAPGKLAAGPVIGPGGRWMEPAMNPHDNLCSKRGPCISFVYFPKGFDVQPVAPR